MKNPFHKIAFFIMISVSHFSYAQNLVPNPSFEEYINCPTNNNQIQFAPPWFNPTLGSPDYYNSCSFSWEVDVPQNWFGYQNARTGIAYAGISVSTAKYGESREYVEVKLSDSLLAGTKYYFSFYVSLPDSIRYATDAVGLYISKDSVFSTNYLHLPYTPQIANLSGNIITDKQNWIQVYGEYIAQGGEKFIIIGNFKDDQNTDTLFVDGGSPIPNYNTVYYYLDDICVSSSPDTCNVLQSISLIHFSTDLYIYPNPAQDYVRIRYFGDNNLLIINIYNIQCIMKKKIYLNAGKNDFHVHVNDLSEGIYFMQIVTAEKIVSQKLIITK